MGFGISDEKEAGSPWDSSISNALSAISRTGAVSPKPDYGAFDTGTGGSGGLMEYGMSPEETTGLYDESFQQGQAAFEPWGGAAGHVADRRRLKGLFNQVEGAYDPTDTIAAMQRSRGMNMMAGEQGANTAARRFEEESGPGQFSGAAGAMVRAQALMPHLREDYEGAAAEGKYATSQKERALDKSTEIATTLAKLQADYTNSLASYNSGKAGFAADFAGKRSGMAVESSRRGVDSELDWRKSQAQIAESARATNLRAALDARGIDQTADTAANAQRLQGATSYLQNAQKPMWEGLMDNAGRPTTNQSGYTDYQKQMEARRRAEGMLI